MPDLTRESIEAVHSIASWLGEALDGSGLLILA